MTVAWASCSDVHLLATELLAHSALGLVEVGACNVGELGQDVLEDPVDQIWVLFDELVELRMWVCHGFTNLD